MNARPETSLLDLLDQRQDQVLRDLDQLDVRIKELAVQWQRDHAGIEPLEAGRG